MLLNSLVSLFPQFRGSRNQYVYNIRYIDMSRPVGYKKSLMEYKRQYSHLIPILLMGLSLRKTAYECKLSVNTIRKIRRIFLGYQIDMSIVGYIMTFIGTLVAAWLSDRIKTKISDKISYYKWRATFDIGYINRIRWYERVSWLRWLSWFERFWFFR